MNHLARRRGRRKQADEKDETIKNLQQSLIENEKTIEKQTEELKRKNNLISNFRKLSFTTNSNIIGASLPAYERIENIRNQSILRTLLDTSKFLESECETLKSKVKTLENELDNKECIILSKDLMIKQYCAIIEENKTALEDFKNIKYQKKVKDCHQLERKCLEAYRWAARLGKVIKKHDVPLCKSDATLLVKNQQQLNDKVSVLKMCNLQVDEEDSNIPEADEDQLLEAKKLKDQETQTYELVENSVIGKDYRKLATYTNDLGVLSPSLTDEGVGLSPGLSEISLENSCTHFKDTFQTYGPPDKERMPVIEDSMIDLLRITKEDCLKDLDYSPHSPVKNSIEKYTAHQSNSVTSLFDPELVNNNKLMNSGVRLDEGIFNSNAGHSLDVPPEKLNMPVVSELNLSTDNSAIDRPSNINDVSVAGANDDVSILDANDDVSIADRNDDDDDISSITERNGSLRSTKEVLSREIINAENKCIEVLKYHDHFEVLIHSEKEVPLETVKQNCDEETKYFRGEICDKINNKVECNENNSNLETGGIDEVSQASEKLVKVMPETDIHKVIPDHEELYKANPVCEEFDNSINEVLQVNEEFITVMLRTDTIDNEVITASERLDEDMLMCGEFDESSSENVEVIPTGCVESDKLSDKVLPVLAITTNCDETGKPCDEVSEEVEAQPIRKEIDRVSKKIDEVKSVYGEFDLAKPGSEKIEAILTISEKSGKLGDKVLPLSEELVTISPISDTIDRLTTIRGVIDQVKGVSDEFVQAIVESKDMGKVISNCEYSDKLSDSLLPVKDQFATVSAISKIMGRVKTVSGAFDQVKTANKELASDKAVSVCEEVDMTDSEETSNIILAEIAAESIHSSKEDTNDTSRKEIDSLYIYSNSHFASEDHSYAALQSSGGEEKSQNLMISKDEQIEKETKTCKKSTITGDKMILLSRANSLSKVDKFEAGTLEPKKLETPQLDTIDKCSRQDSSYFHCASFDSKIMIGSKENDMPTRKLHNDLEDERQDQSISKILEIEKSTENQIDSSILCDSNLCNNISPKKISTSICKARCVENEISCLKTSNDANLPPTISLCQKIVVRNSVPPKSIFDTSPEHVLDRDNLPISKPKYLLSPRKSLHFEEDPNSLEQRPIFCKSNGKCDTEQFETPEPVKKGMVCTSKDEHKKTNGKIEVVEDRILHKIIKRMQMKSIMKGHAVSPIPPSPQTSKQGPSIQMELSLLSRSEEDENSVATESIQKEFELSTANKYEPNQSCGTPRPLEGKNMVPVSKCVTGLPVQSFGSTPTSDSNFKEPIRVERVNKCPKTSFTGIPIHRIKESKRRDGSIKGSPGCSKTKCSVISNNSSTFDISTRSHRKSSSYNHCAKIDLKNFEKHEQINPMFRVDLLHGADKEENLIDSSVSPSHQPSSSKIDTGNETSRRSYNSSEPSCLKALKNSNISIVDQDTSNEVNCTDRIGVEKDESILNPTERNNITIMSSSGMIEPDFEVLLAQILGEVYLPDCIDKLSDTDIITETLEIDSTRELNVSQLNNFKDMRFSNQALEELNKQTTNDTLDNPSSDSIKPSNISVDHHIYSQCCKIENGVVDCDIQNSMIATDADHQHDDNNLKDAKYEEPDPSKNSTLSENKPINDLKIEASAMSKINTTRSDIPSEKLDSVQSNDVEARRSNQLRSNHGFEHCKLDSVSLSLSNDFSDSDESDFEGWLPNEPIDEVDSIQSSDVEDQSLKQLSPVHTFEHYQLNLVKKSIESLPVFNKSSFSDESDIKGWLLNECNGKRRYDSCTKKEKKLINRHCVKETDSIHLPVRRSARVLEKIKKAQLVPNQTSCTVGKECNRRSKLNQTISEKTIAEYEELTSTESMKNKLSKEVETTVSKIKTYKPKRINRRSRSLPSNLCCRITRSRNLMNSCENVEDTEIDSKNSLNETIVARDISEDAFPLQRSSSLCQENSVPTEKVPNGLRNVLKSKNENLSGRPTRRKSHPFYNCDRKLRHNKVDEIMSSNEHDASREASKNSSLTGLQLSFSTGCENREPLDPENSLLKTKNENVSNNACYKDLGQNRIDNMETNVIQEFPASTTSLQSNTNLLQVQCEDIYEQKHFESPMSPDEDLSTNLTLEQMNLDDYKILSVSKIDENSDRNETLKTPSASNELENSSSSWHSRKPCEKSCTASEKLLLLFGENSEDIQKIDIYHQSSSVNSRHNNDLTVDANSSKNKKEFSPRCSELSPINGNTMTDDHDESNHSNHDHDYFGGVLQIDCQESSQNEKFNLLDNDQFLPENDDGTESNRCPYDDVITTRVCRKEDQLHIPVIGIEEHKSLRTSTIITSHNAAPNMKSNLKIHPAPNIVDESATDKTPIIEKVPSFNFYSEVSETDCKSDQCDKRKSDRCDSPNLGKKKRKIEKEEDSRCSEPISSYSSNEKNLDVLESNNTEEIRMVKCKNVIKMAYRYHRKYLYKGGEYSNTKPDESNLGKEFEHYNTLTEELFVRVANATVEENKNKDGNNVESVINVECEYWTSDLIETCLEKLKSVPNNVISEVIIDTLYNDIGDPDLDAAAPLSDLQKKVLTITYKLCSDMSHHSNFFESLLIAFRKFLLLNSESEKVIRYCKYVRFLTVLSRALGKIEEMRWFIYDVLYFKKMSGIPMVYTALCMWSSLLPMASPIEEACPLALCISHVLLNNRINDSHQKSVYKVCELQHLLKRYHGYAETSSPEVFNQLVKKINVDGALEAVALLCKRIGPKWTLTFVIEESLLPILNEWKTKKTNSVEVVNAIRILGYILRPFLQGNNNAKLNDVIRNIGSFLMDPNADERIQAVAAESLCRLSKGNMQLCIELLVNWKPHNGMVPVQLIKQMRAFIARRKPVCWLKVMARTNLIQHQGNNSPRGKD